MRNSIVCILSLIFCKTAYAQIYRDTIPDALLINEMLIDTLDINFSTTIVSDSITPDSANKEFIDEAYQFLDSIKSKKENNILTYTNNFWNDSIHSPGKAALFSALIPGLGQIYNGKWWKVPIVYAGLGTATGFVLYNTYGPYGYRDLKNAIIIRLDGDSTTIDEYASDPNATTDALISAADEVKRYLDISYIATAFVYLLNIIDAIVDAHLYAFDVSDNLSMQLQPYMYYNANTITQINNSYSSQTTFGLKLQLNIK